MTHAKRSGGVRMHSGSTAQRGTTRGARALQPPAVAAAQERGARLCASKGALGFRLGVTTPFTTFRTSRQRAYPPAAMCLKCAALAAMQHGGGPLPRVEQR